VSLATDLHKNFVTLGGSGGNRSNESDYKAESIVYRAVNERYFWENIGIEKVNVR
jgi:hypothetical protein